MSLTSLMRVLFVMLLTNRCWGQVAADLPRPPGSFVPVDAKAHAEAATFMTGEPLVATSYFYWYDIHSKLHFVNHDGTDALTTHPPDDELSEYSNLSPVWHYRQLQQIRRAGIDVILPVYWGVPGDYAQWSNTGLPPLIEAHDRMLAEHRADPKKPAPPAIGMFYDTTTLQSTRGFNVPFGASAPIDLTTERGKLWFYATLRDCFSLIPPAKWARIDGKPIVFLYAMFGSKVDAGIYDDARRRFQADFGVEPYLVRNGDWPEGADATYRWGGAIRLTLGDVVAGIGPGYDHSAVPGREPLIVDRRGGQFYSESWEKMLRMNPATRPWIVHVETWNEWHEGTNVARSREHGDLYMELTRKYARMFHDRLRLPRGGTYGHAEQVRWTPDRSDGLSLRVSEGDGCWARQELDDAAAVVTQSCTDPKMFRYLYVCVDDSYALDESGRSAELTLTLRDRGCEQVLVQYDSADAKAGPLHGAFAQARTIPLTGTGEWRTVKILLPNVRFANRANDADLRFGVMGGDRELAVRAMSLRLIESSSQPAN